MGNKELKRLGGGFVNEVFQEGEQVLKRFTGEELVGIKASERRFREMKALLFYKGGIAPAFFGVDTASNLRQEYIQGEVLEKVVVEGGEMDLEEVGRLLRTIHRPCEGGIERLRRELETKWLVSRQKAAGLLEHLNLRVLIVPDWQEVLALGVTRVHRDFWLGNVIKSKRGLVAIDWEFAGIGSPYEDFAIVELWIFKEYEQKYPGLRECFWQGYGCCPSEVNIRAFLQARCVEFLATTTIEAYEKEEEDGFYHNKIKLLRDLR